MGRESNLPLTTQVAAFTTTLDAELARTLLMQHDIASRLEGDVLAAAALPLQTAFGGVRVFVAQEQAEEAYRLIEQHEKALAADRRPADTADDRVARAYRLALVGLIVVPVLMHAISLLNLLRAPWSSLSAKGRRHYMIGVVLDLMVLVPALYLVVRMLTP